MVEWIRSFDGDLELQLFLKKHTPSGLTAEKEFVLKVNSLVIVQIVLVLLTITGFSLWMCNVNRNMKGNNVILFISLGKGGLYPKLILMIMNNLFCMVRTKINHWH